MIKTKHMENNDGYKEFVEAIGDLLLAIKNSQELADKALEKVREMYVGLVK